MGSFGATTPKFFDEEVITFFSYLGAHGRTNKVDEEWCAAMSVGSQEAAMTPKKLMPFILVFSALTLFVIIMLI
ncbi:hypothetical protein K3172_07320 [Qipengyuania sp. 6B39]|uniref:hypothetical protein n=1 Tax=Qipengyuania proteolytica TaxID=2867239 RepID=UPI001C89C920|nr:hypothetical protein [Qipengyuania proteolytica]MBX7495667.1 hypothetical protein [Qipengyuania proteolytica]